MSQANFHISISKMRPAMKKPDPSTAELQLYYYHGN